MPHTPNPPAFEAAVRAYLEPAREQFNYDQMLLTFLSVDRFRRWANVISRYRSLAGARVLSSGCGFGGSLLAYRDAGAADVVGVEVSDEYARFAGLRVADLAAAGIALYDGTHLPFPAASFDVIESIDVVEHAADARTYLAELRRVLAPGGIILLATPNRLWPVEQHLGIVGPPWLPVALADRLFAVLARAPWIAQERRFRYERLRGMRERNVSLWRLRRLSLDLGLSLRLPDPADFDGDWPLPRDPVWIEALLRHRFSKFAAPARTLVTVLGHLSEHPGPAR